MFSYKVRLSLTSLLQRRNNENNFLQNISKWNLFKQDNNNNNQNSTDFFSLIKKKTPTHQKYKRNHPVPRRKRQL